MAFVGFLAVAGFVGIFVAFKTYKIPSGSMEPTLQIGDHLFASRWTYRFRDPRRGDVAIFESVDRPGHVLVSRVVGIPGDRIEIRDKRLFVNRQAVDEPYVKHEDPKIYPRDDPGPSKDRDNFRPLVLEEDLYFVLGDNRDNSYDGRFYGPVPRASFLHGPPMLIYLSFGDRGVRWERTGKHVR